MEEPGLLRSVTAATDTQTGPAMVLSTTSARRAGPAWSRRPVGRAGAPKAAFNRGLLGTSEAQASVAGSCTDVAADGRRVVVASPSWLAETRTTQPEMPNCCTARSSGGDKEMEMREASAASPRLAQTPPGGSVGGKGSCSKERERCSGAVSGLATPRSASKAASVPGVLLTQPA